MARAEMPNGPILALEGVAREFGGLVAVDNCSFTVEPGTITGLIGPNGAGKSTLFNLITGFIPCTSGRIYFHGDRIDGAPAHTIARRRLTRTFQIPGELRQMTTLENLMLVPEGQSGESLWKAWLLPWRVRSEEIRIQERAMEVLEILGLDGLRDELAGNLSTGQKKLLELGRALMADPDLILLDEPAAGVNPTLMRTLVGLLRKLRDEKGVSFLLIEHDMEVVMGLCDPVIVMARGRILAEGPPEQIQNDPLVLEAYLGGGRVTQDSPILKVTDVSGGYGGATILNGVSMHVGQGEILAIIGPNGSGKSTLMKTIFGLLTPDSGAVEFAGNDITGTAPDRVVKMGVGYVPQAENVFPSLTIRENLEMGAFTVSGDSSERIAQMLALFPDLEDRGTERAGNLSGGQRQMLALARSLMLDPRLLLLDEPTAGLAPAAVRSVMGRVSDINAAGVAIVLVEQNALAALRISSRAYVLARGRNQLEGEGSALLADPEVGRLYLGRGDGGAP